MVHSQHLTGVMMMHRRQCHLYVLAFHQPLGDVTSGNTLSCPGFQMQGWSSL